MYRKKSSRGWIIAVLILVLGLAAGILGWRWYDSNVDRSGWKSNAGKTFYTDFYGDPLSGWQDIDGQRYYLGPDGTASTGWQDIGGKRYYLGTDGVLRTGWQEVGGERYYLNEDGTLHTGWLELGEGRRYLSEEGIYLTGLQEIDGNRYYLDENGLVTAGWQTLEDGSYYFGEDGIGVSGRQTLEGYTYFFGENGAMHTGWLEAEEGTSFFVSNGIMATGLTDIDGKRYYFDDNGMMHTGWLQLGEYRYYFLSDGTAAVGPNEIDGQTWFFTPKGVQIYLVNPWNYVPKDYNPELIQLSKGPTVDASCADALDRMLDDCIAAGLSPLVRSSYRTQIDQSVMHQNRIRRYMEEDGYSYDYSVYLAKQSVAIPGTSEHQLGLAVDITDMYEKQLNATQENTKVAKWLLEHCWEYGFILRYPTGTMDITGIIYEPWHYRYVGVEVAMELKELGITLEEYLDAVRVEEE